MRPRVLLFGLAAIVIVALFVLGVADQFLVDFLWFSSLGYRSVFDKIVGAEVGIFVAVWVVAFVPILISGLVAVALSHEREHLRVVRRHDELAEVNLPELIRALSDRVPWRILVVLASALLAIFPAQGEAAGWDIYLKAMY